MDQSGLARAMLFCSLVILPIWSAVVIVDTGYIRDALAHFSAYCSYISEEPLKVVGPLFRLGELCVAVILAF